MKTPRQPYEKPAVVYERDLEALAANCGVGELNIWAGDNNCKGEGPCVVVYS